MEHPEVVGYDKEGNTRVILENGFFFFKASILPIDKKQPNWKI